MSARRPSVLERAYELARSGRCWNLTDIRRRLDEEGFEDVRQQLYGGALARDLYRLCLVAQGKKPPGPGQAKNPKPAAE
jgi:hypothetical protein